jgi:hypothetical protein
MVTAAGKSDLGTKRGTTACHGAAVIAPAASIKNTKHRRAIGVTSRIQTRTAKAAHRTVVTVSAKMSSRLLSTMSARTPAGRAKRNTGTVEATCTSETITGLESSVVMSHAAAAAYIQLPMFATTVAVQMTENAV